MSRPDPVRELLLAADLPGLHERACARARDHARAGEILLERAWADLAAAAHELMPAQLTMSRVKSSTGGELR